MPRLLENFIELTLLQSEEGERVVRDGRWWFAFVDDLADVLRGLRHPGVALRSSKGLRVRGCRRGVIAASEEGRDRLDRARPLS